MRRLLLLLAILLVLPASAAAMSTEDCFDCHSDDTLTKEMDGREVSLFVEEEPYFESTHGDMDCSDCHEDTANLEDEHPEILEKVACDNCHDDAGEEMSVSSHVPDNARVDSDLPSCASCHGKHKILPTHDSRAMTYDLNVPSTCCVCHGNGEIISRHPTLSAGICADYEDGMHGRVLIKSGLIFSAVCNDCHGSHDVRSPSDSQAMVNRQNINSTCSSCHAGIVDVYLGSIHGSLFEGGEENAPTCVSCHGSHRVERAMDKEFLITVTDRCSGCHEEAADTFRDTYHGQVTGLGYSQAAQCPDCHGAHDILPQDDPASMIHADNLAETCSTCHPGAGPNFTMYFPHADYHDAEKYPGLYYVYLAMVILLSSVFIFFGIHTLLWFIRAHLEERSRP
jgi:DnaJ-class molecular chaperone